MSVTVPTAHAWQLALERRRPPDAADTRAAIASGLSPDERGEGSEPR